MKFFCLCMSPAIDATVRLPSAPKGEGEIFKDVVEEENVGGKAVNVARWLAIRGAEVACGGLLGEDNDRPFAKELAKYAIGDRFVRVPGATRRNEMIVWPGGSVKLNRAAFPGLAAVPSLDSLLSLSSFSSSAVAILSGSLPPVVPKDFYASAVARLKSLGFTVVLDASGAALVEGVKAHPDVIKPNAEECEPLVGFVPKAPSEFAKATDILREKVAHVIISDGGAGAWFDGEFVAAPKIDVVDTTAAGDTLLAEWCWRVFGEADLSRVEHVERVDGEGAGVLSRDAAGWAVAAGSAACTMPGGAPPSASLVDRLFKRE
ncbi:MAG: 1-phosphofructokinase [Kiritimatiellae bacterium]|nr:1-phosphofructokinase [Kiritimatiellia bacterium]